MTTEIGALDGLLLLGGQGSLRYTGFADVTGA
jgi:hypothetical protein